MGDPEETAAPPRVFISYSHDSPEHEALILHLAQCLRANRVDAWIDQFEPWPKIDWPRWMEERLGWGDYVMMICTETYFRRITAEAPADTGRGYAGRRP